MIVRDTSLQLGQRYGVALLVESALLLAAIPLIHDHANLGLWLMAGASGLQNAMVTTFSGAVVRTTHMTGIVTDLGILLGHRLRGLAVDGLRARLYLLLFGAFLGGGFAGAYCLRHLARTHPAAARRAGGADRSRLYRLPAAAPRHRQGYRGASGPHLRINDRPGAVARPNLMMPA